MARLTYSNEVIFRLRDATRGLNEFPDQLSFQLFRGRVVRPVQPGLRWQIRLNSSRDGERFVQPLIYRDLFEGQYWPWR